MSAVEKLAEKMVAMETKIRSTKDEDKDDDTATQKDNKDSQSK